MTRNILRVAHRQSARPMSRHTLSRSPLAQLALLSKTNSLLHLHIADFGVRSPCSAHPRLPAYSTPMALQKWSPTGDTSGRIPIISSVNHPNARCEDSSQQPSSMTTMNSIRSPTKSMRLRYNKLVIASFKRNESKDSEHDLRSCSDLPRINRRINQRSLFENQFVHIFHLLLTAQSSAVQSAVPAATNSPRDKL